MKKILKIIGIVLIIFIAGSIIIVSARQNLKYDGPYPSINASKDSNVIARGKHLVNSIAHCADCHSKANVDSLIELGLDVPLSGGVEFKLPVGDIYSANITSDSIYGIGKFTDAQIARVLRFGIHPNGNAVYDFMPFHNLSDEDLTAILSYLRTQKPVASKKPENSLNMVGKIVNAFLVKPIGPSENIPHSVTPDTTAEYGRYLVLNVANCSGCHTKRSLSGAYTGKLLAGGSDMNGNIPPNLTPDSSSRIFGWTEDVFIARFKAGKLIPTSEMPWNTFKRMTNNELKAIYKYLHTIEPAKTDSKS